MRQFRCIFEKYNAAHGSELCEMLKFTISSISSNCRNTNIYVFHGLGSFSLTRHSSLLNDDFASHNI